MDRNIVNLISLLISIVMILIATKLSDGNFANETITMKSNENFDQLKMSNSLQEQTQYTELNLTEIYVKRLEFNQEGMDYLYHFTAKFLNLIITKDINTSDFVRVENNRIRITNLTTQWRNILRQYWHVLLFIILLVFLIAMMPLFGLGYCCCRCCGRCGAKSRPYDKKYDCCRKFYLATFMIILWTLLLFCVVCVFVTNQQLENGVNELVGNLRKNVHNTNQYLNHTDQQIGTLLIKNYDEFQTTLSDTLTEGNDIVYNELAKYSNANLMQDLTGIVDKLPKIKEKFETLQTISNALQVNAENLRHEIGSLKANFTKDLQNCPNGICRNIANDLNKLNVDITFDHLPNMKPNIDRLNDLLANDKLTNAIQDGKDILDNVKKNITQTVNTTLIKARDQINSGRSKIHGFYQNISSILTNLQRDLDEVSNTNLKTADFYIHQYNPYRYYASVTIATILLIISICIGLGLICGICGNRPDLYGDDDCCNKGAGSQFLVCTILLMFFSACVVGAVILIGFLTGTLAQRLICDQIRQPQSSAVLKLLDHFHIRRNTIEINVPQIITLCHRNQSAYKVFNLKQQFDIDQLTNYTSAWNISILLDGLDLSRIQFNKDFHILSPADERQLEELENLDFSTTTFDTYMDTLQDNFTTVNLATFNDELNTVISNLRQIPDSRKIQKTIEAVVDFQIELKRIENDVLQPMHRNVTIVVDTARSLNDDLKLNHGSFSGAIQYILRELHSVETTLIQTGTKRLQLIAKEFAQNAVDQIDQYVNRTVILTEYDVGRCGPLSEIMNNTLTATCDKILMPWNGYWFALLWALVLFIPTVIVAIKLSKLYQNLQSYGNHRHDGEYLYDAYADQRDNIPLNSRQKSRNKKRKLKKSKRYEDRPMTAPPLSTGGGDLVVASAHHHHRQSDTHRYADMAAKHWDEASSAAPITGSGGPPHYQRAPTEYERPPPYYYHSGSNNGENP